MFKELEDFIDEVDKTTERKDKEGLSGEGVKIDATEFDDLLSAEIESGEIYEVVPPYSEGGYDGIIEGEIDPTKQEGTPIEVVPDIDLENLIMNGVYYSDIVDTNDKKEKI